MTLESIAIITVNEHEYEHIFCDHDNYINYMNYILFITRDTN